MPAFRAGTLYNMLVYVRQCRRSAGSVGSADKSVGTLHLHTLRNELKINRVQTKSAECRQFYKNKQYGGISQLTQVSNLDGYGLKGQQHLAQGKRSDTLGIAC